MQIKAVRYHFHPPGWQRSGGLLTPYVDEGMGGKYSCLGGHANRYTLLQGQAGNILKSTLHVPFDLATPLRGFYPR